MLTFILYILGGLAVLSGGFTVVTAFVNPEAYVQYFGTVDPDVPIVTFASGFVFLALGRILFLLNDIRDQSNKDDL